MFFDTHVYRISNSLKTVSTKNPLQKKGELKKIFHKNCWNKMSDMFIFYGQQVCKLKILYVHVAN